MRIGDVIGKLTLSAWHPVLGGGTYKLVVPLSLENLIDGTPAEAEELVVYDELGAGTGSRIAFSESREAAQPFHPAEKPIDAYNAAILDHLDIERPA